MSDYHSLLQKGEIIKKICTSLQKCKVEAENEDFDDDDLIEIEYQISLVKEFLACENVNNTFTEFMDTIVNNIMQHNFLYSIIECLSLLNWEARKNVVDIWENILLHQKNFVFPAVNFIQMNKKMLPVLIEGYNDITIALNCGTILRECAKNEHLSKTILFLPEFYQFFEFVENSLFDISSDAYITMKDLLTRHKEVVSNFLELNYEDFFSSYEKLLRSENYVTRRQFIKLLSEIILDRNNINTMMKFISNSHNLKVIMLLLKDEKVTIQVEAFHVFKVFVANPHKTEPILKLLGRNKKTFLSFLQNFHVDKEDDEFEEEKEALCESIKDVPDYPSK